MNYFCTVKNKVRITGAVLLAAYYCLAIGGVAMPFVYFDIHSQPGSSQEIFVAELPGSLFSHTTQTENSLRIVHAFPVQTLINSGDGFFTITKATELLVENAFSQYSSKALGMMINERKSDLIFPFHYFW